MATLSEIIDDKKTYPDDRKVTLADGVETTIGELRSGYMKERDYRQKTSEVAENRRQFERERTDFLTAKQEAEAQLETLAAKIVRREPEKRDDLAAAIDEDPIGSALSKRIAELDSKLEKVDGFIKATEDKFRNHETAFVASQHRLVMEKLKSYDPDLDEATLIDFCKQNNLGRLDQGYRLMTEETRMKREVEKAKTEARQAGIDEGKKLAVQTRIPSQRVVLSDRPDEKDPKTFDEAADAALNDPEIADMLSNVGGM